MPVTFDECKPSLGLVAYLSRLTAVVGLSVSNGQDA